MMFFLKPILIFAILAPNLADVAANNVTVDFVYPTEGLEATLMFEHGYKINWILNPNCPQPEVKFLSFNCTKGSLDTNLATTVAAIKVVPPEAALTDETMVQENKIPTNSWIWSMVAEKSPALMVSVRLSFFAC